MGVELSVISELNAYFADSRWFWPRVLDAGMARPLCAARSSQRPLGPACLRPSSISRSARPSWLPSEVPMRSWVIERVGQWTPSLARATFRQALLNNMGLFDMRSWISTHAALYDREGYVPPRDSCSAISAQPHQRAPYPRQHLAVFAAW